MLKITRLRDLGISLSPHHGFRPAASQSAVTSCCVNSSSHSPQLLPVLGLFSVPCTCPAQSCPQAVLHMPYPWSGMLSCRPLPAGTFCVHLSSEVTSSERPSPTSLCSSASIPFFPNSQLISCRAVSPSLSILFITSLYVCLLY